MPQDRFGNTWDTQVQAACWEAYSEGWSRPSAHGRGFDETLEQHSARFQPLAEAWARETGWVDPTAPTMETRIRYTIRGESFTSLEAAVYYNRCISNTLEGTTRRFLAKSQVLRDRDAIAWKANNPSRWGGLMAAAERNGLARITEQVPVSQQTEEPTMPIENLWPQHRMGPYRPDSFGDYPTQYGYYVHGYGFTTRDASRYYTGLLNTRDDGDDTTRRFPHWSTSEQEDWMEQFPLAPWNAPVEILASGLFGVGEWRMGSLQDAQFLANLVARGHATLEQGSDNLGHRFAVCSQSQRNAYRQQEPTKGAALNPAEIMPQHRSPDGKFASKPKPKKGEIISNIIYRAIRKAVCGKVGDQAPKSKKPRHTPDQIMAHFSGKSYCPSEMKRCHPSGTWRQDGEYLVVYTNPENRRTTKAWDPDYLQGNGYQCGGSRKHFSNAYEWIVTYDHGEDVKFEKAWALERGYVVWESDGLWHARPEPMTPAQRQAQIRALGDNSIPQYHHIKTAWRNAPSDPSVVKFGIELEIQSPQRRKICTLAESLGFVGEQDGSLCRQTGLEIIGPPFTFSEIQDKAGKWRTLLNGIVGEGFGVKGWRAGKGYGMHVSVSREALKTDHQIRFLCFFNNDTRSLCETIAGRNETERAFAFRKKPKDERAFDSPDKYEACWAAGRHRLEVRIFRSTVKEERFLTNVEFCAAGVEYTRDGKLDHSQNGFLDWMKAKANQDMYHNLAKFLKENEDEIRNPKKKKVFDEPEDIPSPPRRTVNYGIQRVYDSQATVPPPQWIFNTGSSSNSNS